MSEAMLEIKDVITDPKELDRMYSQPAAPSLRKVTQSLTGAYRRMIEASPFVAVATCGADGLDCSPRGDSPGFVRVADNQTLLLPERRGNNRIDSLRNLVADPRITLLFLVPGIPETLRVNGRATISSNHELCDSFSVNGSAPRVVIVVRIESVYFQCGRAILRSQLWNPSLFRNAADLPTAGAMLAEATAGEEGGPAYDAALPDRMRTTLY
jgi:PPOX class probable FMN-dependent enzyme